MPVKEDPSKNKITFFYVITFRFRPTLDVPERKVQRGSHDQNNSISNYLYIIFEYLNILISLCEEISESSLRVNVRVHRLS